MNQFSRFHLRLKDPCWELYHVECQWNYVQGNGSACCDFCREPYRLADPMTQSFISKTITCEFRARDDYFGSSSVESFTLCENCASIITKIIELHRKTL